MNKTTKTNKLYIFALLIIVSFLIPKFSFAQTAAATATKETAVKATAAAITYTIGNVLPTAVRVSTENKYFAPTDIPSVTKPSVTKLSCFFIPDANYSTDRIPAILQNSTLTTAVLNPDDTLTVMPYTYVTKGIFPALFACEVSDGKTSTITKGLVTEIKVTSLLGSIIDTIVSVIAPESEPAPIATAPTETGTGEGASARKIFTGPCSITSDEYQTVLGCKNSRSAFLWLLQCFRGVAEKPSSCDGKK